MRTLSNLLAYSLVVATPLFAFAQAPNAEDSLVGDTVITEEHQRLSDQLLERWDQTPLPAFLQNKKSVIDEVMSTGIAMPIEDVRGILSADSVRSDVKLSSLVDFSVYSSIQSQTSMKYLLKNLESGHLEPRANKERYSQFGVYLELHLLASPKPFAWGDVELHFSPEILDRKDYHVSLNWDYGNYGPAAASPAVNMGRMTYFLGTLLKKGIQNELVFHERVPLSLLVKIVVPIGKKATLMKALAAKRLQSPTAQPWEALIVEQEMPAPKPKEQN